MKKLTDYGEAEFFTKQATEQFRQGENITSIKYLLLRALNAAVQSESIGDITLGPSTQVDVAKAVRDAGV